MNSWICEWEPQRANVMLSGAQAVYIVELKWRAAHLCLLLWLCLDEELQAHWMLLRSSSSQPLFVCAPPPTHEIRMEIPHLCNKTINMIMYFPIHLQAVRCMSPTRVIHFNAATGIISYCSVLLSDVEQHRHPLVALSHIQFPPVCNWLSYRRTLLPCQSRRAL